ncbi:MAG: polysaccharide deacetylase family protein [Muribaculaceae bacterium]|nr:polysaccharide deacetylase family protein [Muribaculaceae bacterium]
MNYITFDIEEWFLEKQNHGNRSEKIAEYDRYLNEILDLLDECELKATFFCVGGMAEDFANVIKQIDHRGHEVGCHSYRHTWLNKMQPNEVLEDTRRAINLLEQCIGKKVVSYRSPAFSIGENNTWALDILANCGIERDSSIFPAKRDFGGFSNFGHKTPVIIERKGCMLKEFPICMTTILGKEIAYSGGGYFRLFPLWFVKREMARSDYAMCYFHLDDIIPESSKMMSREYYEAYFKEPGTLVNRYKRHIKSNLGKKTAYGRMISLIRTFKFINLAQAEQEIDWSQVPIVKL